MIIAHHIIFGTNSHWLPNDERGSGSECVRSEALQEFGPATRTNSRVSVANVPYNRERRQAMESVLKYPPVHLSDEQIQLVGNGFSQAIQDSGYIVYACAVMSTHVHIVVARHEYEAVKIMKHFKTRATQHLKWVSAQTFSGTFSERTCSPPPRSPSPWQHRGWVVFINTESHLWATINYVERHYAPPQAWEFVRPIGGRPIEIGR